MRANALAHELVHLGVGPNTFVGVMLDRSNDLLLSFLAIMKVCKNARGLLRVPGMPCLLCLSQPKLSEPQLSCLELLLGVPAFLIYATAAAPCLQAGGCYVPLDVCYPNDRLANYLEDCEAAVLISSASHAHRANTLAGNMATWEASSWIIGLS